jgi:hypothetical protein
MICLAGKSISSLFVFDAVSQRLSAVLTGNEEALLPLVSNVFKAIDGVGTAIADGIWSSVLA